MLIAALSLLLIVPTENEDDSTAARLRQLEEQVQALQKRVEALESRPAVARPSTPPPQEKAWDIPVGDSAVLGSGPIDLVVFTDFQCPFCARVHPTLVEIVTSRELKGRVRLVYKYFPLSFHKDAKPAALMSLAVRELGGDAAFWKFVTLCYENQRALDGESLSRFAQAAGVNAGRAERLLVQNAEKYAETLAEDQRLAQKIHVRGTPQLFVGGWELRTRSLEGVLDLIKEKKL